MKLEKNESNHLSPSGMMDSKTAMKRSRNPYFIDDDPTANINNDEGLRDVVHHVKFASPDQSPVLAYYALSTYFAISLPFRPEQWADAWFGRPLLGLHCCVHFDYSTNAPCVVNGKSVQHRILDSHAHKARPPLSIWLHSGIGVEEELDGTTMGSTAANLGSNMVLHSAPITGGA
ncbi:hypothetical protein CDAR_120041 [Caerostris darwini]|uniref:Uncharacterized protein n=1 Tax=Caerostris darwini TaxID=1538125 RepID=A0AAV4T258_9ARAC|nr:hypothetical protein CDAR_120041 [Caerostris darwini]